MDAIFKQENVYIVVRNKDIRESVDDNNVEGLIWNNDKSQNTVSLYGGRVILKPYYNYGGYSSYDRCRIEIDGILIYQINDSLQAISEFSFESVAAYLNQIENLGVDTFLENYKLQLQELKKEFETTAENIQQELAMNDDDKKATLLHNLKKIILKMTCIIFSLLINLNAGLDNHYYTTAYDIIINQYF